MAVARPARTEHRSRQLVERDDALATLRGSLDEAAAGTGRIVLIRGEAGIGKTTLLKAFVEDCASDVDVAWGDCDGVSTPQPYGPFEDMADALGAEFRGLLDANAARGEVGRWLLKWMAAGPRRVLVIEDVHWADQATLDLLAFLARRIESLPVLLLVTLRDGDGRAPSVDRILGGVASLPVLRQLPLEPLSRPGVERLASDTGVDARELHRITAGNPFYVHEVLDAGGWRKGDVIALGSRSLEVMYTPGHASHHICLVDSDTGSLFTGDALGIHLPDAGVLRPATPAPDFDRDVAHGINGNHAAIWKARFQRACAVVLQSNAHAGQDRLPVVGDGDVCGLVAGCVSAGAANASSRAKSNSHRRATARARFKMELFIGFSF